MQQQEGACWYVAGRYESKNAARKAKDDLYEAIRHTSGHNISIYAVDSTTEDAWFAVALANGIPPFHIREVVSKAFKKTGGQEHTFPPGEIAPLLQNHLDHFNHDITVVPGTFKSRRVGEIED